MWGAEMRLNRRQYDQLQDNPNLQQSLDTLNKTYDAFVKKHGFMHWEQHTVSERENEDGSTTVTKRFKKPIIVVFRCRNALARANKMAITPISTPSLLGRVINKPITPVITSTQRCDVCGV